MEATKIKQAGKPENKCRQIFSWHNGLMMEEQLNELTHEDFKLKEKDTFDDYTFVNSKDEVVQVDLEGNVILTDIYLPAIFQARAKKRLLRTEEMFSMFSK